MKPGPLFKDLDGAISRSQELLLAQQDPEGYWWYTLEANESIAAEYIFLTEFLGIRDPQVDQGLCQRILHQQREDGSWALYYGGPGDLGTSLECYWALKLCGYEPEHPAMERARYFILKAGGPTKVRVFTKIHLALFGLAPWESAPAMPLWFMLFPKWSPANIYEFSSWARACIVPLLVILDRKPVHPLDMDLEELYPDPPSRRSWRFVQKDPGLNLESFFTWSNRLLKALEKFPGRNPFRKKSLKVCEKYIREHIEKTEDIFPALAYGAMALKTLGYANQDPVLSKAVRALRSFQQPCSAVLPALPKVSKGEDYPPALHQQCCISPVWDTPWAALSLVDSGMSPHHPALEKAGNWLLEKQITQCRGDWAVKNPEAAPGGWSFEFENDYFPDVDDSIEVLQLLYKQGLETPERKKAFHLGYQWLLSMQSKNGGWAAFDVDNLQQWVNRIPFSDHGACLDPPTPDITGRMLEFLATVGHDKKDPRTRKALEFIYGEQVPVGAWEGRWGVNYLYGTWCVLQGLMAWGQSPQHPAVLKATQWLLAQQNPDGGWGESCGGYLEKKFVPLPHSVPSQSAWALMALIAVGKADSAVVKRGVEYLLESQNGKGSWDEEAFTGTGFPGHFYIRYHGYRHYFPLMALGKYRRALGET